MEFHSTRSLRSHSANNTANQSSTSTSNSTSSSSTSPQVSDHVPAISTQPFDSSPVSSQNTLQQQQHTVPPTIEILSSFATYNNESESSESHNMRKKRKTESLSNLQSSSNSSETSRKLKGKAEPHDDDESEYEFDEQAFRRELNITDEMDQAMQTFQEEMTLLKAVTEESFKRLCKMKEDEITIEEQLVENETHPEFQRLIAAAEEKASKRRRLLEYKRKLEENSILESYEAQLKLAHDSLLDSRRRIRSKVMTKVSSERYKLMAEYESTMNKNPTPSLTISPAVTRQRKEIAMYQSHSVSLIPITEWAQEQIEKLTSALHDSPAKSKKKMVDSDEEDEDDDNAVKAEGKPNLAVIGTAACTSATEGEKDDDIKFIKLLSEYESHSILVE